MDEMRVSSLVGELHQPFRQCSERPPPKQQLFTITQSLQERGREKYRTEKKEKGEGGGSVQKDDKIKVVCEICQALI